MSDKKRIRVTEAQHEVLHDLKRPGESYADVISRVLDAAGVDSDGDVAAAQN